MRAHLLLLVLFMGCGRTGLTPEGDGGFEPLPPAPPLVECPRGDGKAQLVANAPAKFVSSLAVEGNDLFIASHVPFLPMLYRLRGSVVRVPRCGSSPDGGVELAADQDRPQSLVATPGWVHWSTADNDFTGTNNAWHVQSRSRSGTQSIDRRLAPDADRLSSLMLADGTVHWLESRAQELRLVGSAEGQSTANLLGSFQEDTTGRWELFAAGPRLALINVNRLGMKAWSLTRAGTDRQPLWTSSDRPDVITVADAVVYYVTFDSGAMTRVIKRQSLTDLAAPTQILTLGTDVPPAMVAHSGDLFFAVSSGITRLRLTGGTTTTWPVALDANQDEAVSALAVADGRLYFAVSTRSRIGGNNATVWALDLR